MRFLHKGPQKGPHGLTPAAHMRRPLTALPSVAVAFGHRRGQPLVRPHRVLVRRFAADAFKEFERRDDGIDYRPAPATLGQSAPNMGLSAACPRPRYGRD